MNKSSEENTPLIGGSRRYCGKWILAGEHSILRGGQALVFPVYSRYLEAHVQQSSGFSSTVEGVNASDYEFLLPGLVDRALAQVEKKRSDLAYSIHVDSHLPLGSGLGASAALCVLVGELFSELEWLKSEDVYEFSRQLENVFHDESSGVDIASCMHKKGICFERGPEITLLDVQWKPYWYLYYSGQRGITSESVRQVKSLFVDQKENAEKWDSQMKKAVENCRDSLAMDSEQGLPKLRDAMQSASDVFENWGLYTPQMYTAKSHLESLGAMAVKPTGSGGGGFLLALFDQPIEVTDPMMISCW